MYNLCCGANKNLIQKQKLGYFFIFQGQAAKCPLLASWQGFVGRGQRAARAVKQRATCAVYWCNPHTARVCACLVQACSRGSRVGRGSGRPTGRVGSGWVGSGPMNFTFPWVRSGPTLVGHGWVGSRSLWVGSGPNLPNLKSAKNIRQSRKHMSPSMIMNSIYIVHMRHIWAIL